MMILILVSDDDDKCDNDDNDGENDNVKMPLTRFAVVGTIVNFLLTGTILVLIQVFTILFLTILQLLFGLDEGFHNSIFNFSCDVTYLVLGQVSGGNLQFF